MCARVAVLTHCPSFPQFSIYCCFSLYVLFLSCRCGSLLSSREPDVTFALCHESGDATRGRASEGIAARHSGHHVAWEQESFWRWRLLREQGILGAVSARTVWCWWWVAVCLVYCHVVHSVAQVPEHLRASMEQEVIYLADDSELEESVVTIVFLVLQVCVCAYIYAYIHVQISMYVYIHACIYLYSHIYTYIYIYTYMIVQSN